MDNPHFNGTVDAVAVDDAVVGRIFHDDFGPNIGLKLFQDGNHDTFAIPADVASYIASAIFTLLGER